MSDSWRVEHGNCLDVMKSLPDNSVDAIVTDPPYGLSSQSAEDVISCLQSWISGESYDHSKSGFMGKSWDSWVPGPEIWKEAFRVLKPGGHLLAFAGSRTVDLMGIAIRLGGFEIRDQLQWIYGSGFPKSLDVSKAIDKAAGVEREDKFEGSFSRFAGPTGNKKCESCGKWLVSGSPCMCPRPQDTPATDAVKQWSGWGTALKPAHEPIVLARKPLTGTVAQNVLAHGTGAINVDGCRVAYADASDYEALSKGVEAIRAKGGVLANSWKNSSDLSGANPASAAGRWPANVLLDEEAARMLDEQSGVSSSVVRKPTGNSIYPTEGTSVRWNSNNVVDNTTRGYEDSGGCSRFFYTSKTSQRERNAGVEGQNIHPTVKPLDLMRYLCRMITPPGGLVLDPFTGSGSTGCAATLEGFQFIGAELNEEYVKIARDRITYWSKTGSEDKPVKSKKKISKPETDKDLGILDLFTEEEG